jgi:hypothetical protein
MVVLLSRFHIRLNHSRKPGGLLANTLKSLTLRHKIGLCMPGRVYRTSRIIYGGNKKNEDGSIFQLKIDQ